MASFTPVIRMFEIRSRTMRVGNSVGVVIPAEVARREKLRVGEELILIGLRKPDWKRFRPLRFRGSLQREKDEIRKGWR